MLSNAILAARPLGAPPAIGGAGIPRPGSKPIVVMPSAILAARAPVAVPKAAAPAPVAVAASKPSVTGRSTKEERLREIKRDINSRIAAFADTKPSKKKVRDFFAARISELNDEIL